MAISMKILLFMSCIIAAQAFEEVLADELLDSLEAVPSEEVIDGESEESIEQTTAEIERMFFGNYEPESRRKYFNANSDSKEEINTNQLYNGNNRRPNKYQNMDKSSDSDSNSDSSSDQQSKNKNKHKHQNHSHYYQHNPSNTNNNNNKNKSCKEKKMFMGKAVKAMTKKVYSCKEKIPTMKYKKCEAALATVTSKKNELKSTLKKCQRETGKLFDTECAIKENVGKCEGKNNVLTPQLADLKAKFTDLSTLETKEKKDVTGCQKSETHCRKNVMKECKEHCSSESGSKSKDSDSSDSSSQSHG